MSDLAGLISRAPAATCRHLLTAMLDTLAPRSEHLAAATIAPDLGVYVGQARPLRADQAASPRPPTPAQPQLLLVGECVRSDRDDASPDLAALGRRFAAEGRAAVRHLNGSFAGLFIDRRRKAMSLFNDRYGSERIYYVETKDGLICLARDVGGNTTTSQTRTVSVANVTAQTAPTISTQPTSTTVSVGQMATFSVVAAGSSPLSISGSSTGSPLPAPPPQHTRRCRRPSPTVAAVTGWWSATVRDKSSMA